VSDKAPSEVLEDAADLLETNGWIQGSFGTNGEAHCALGAVYEAASYRGSYVRSVTALTDVVHERFGFRSIPHWNDQAKTTKQEVVDTMRYAAKQERMKEEGLL
jgi:hypothetical protein